MLRDATSAIDLEHSRGHTLKWLHFSHHQNVTGGSTQPRGATVGPWAPALLGEAPFPICLRAAHRVSPQNTKA